MTRFFFAAVAALFCAGCQCAQLPDALFACEADGHCAQAGYVCGSDQICRAPKDGGSIEVTDASVSNDSGVITVDSGTPGDAGALSDSGMMGVDAGATDSGMPGTDAGPMGDAGGGSDAGGMMTDAGGGSGDAGGGPGDAGGGPGDAGGGPGDAGGGSDDAGGPTDAGGCVTTADEPDDLFQPGVDTNCDGIDGDLSIAALVDTVTGDDLGGNGSMLKPYRTIAKALSTLKPQILVSKGTYSESLLVTSGRIFGGYDQSAGWARTGSRPIIVGTVEVQGNGTNVTLDFITIAAPAQDAGASVALTVVGVDAGTRIRRSLIQASFGETGKNGPPRFLADPGLDGNVGISSDDGGFGGAEVPYLCTGITTNTSSAGGAGGYGARVDGDGQRGAPLVGGGDGGVGIICMTLPCLGLAGGQGIDGADGTVGSGGTAQSPSLFLGKAWLMGQAPNGGPGSQASGGAGAGGGGAVNAMSGMLILLGGGGGSGGAAGCPGQGGFGGQGGGASVALLVVGAGGPTLEANTFQTDTGGAGGSGSAGQIGGRGGAGARGGIGQPDAPGSAGGAGGVGGAGGRGGRGGTGGGGAGGPSVGVWCEGSAAPVFVGTTNVYLLGTPGVGGGPNGVAGAQQDTHNCP